MKKPILLVYIAGATNEIHPAIYYLASYASSQLKTLRFLTVVYPPDCSVSKITNDILSKQPGMVGFSTYIWNSRKTLQITQGLKQAIPKLPVILGGPEAFYHAHALLKTRSDIDVIVTDEGEGAFAELVGFYVYKKPKLAQIKGIWFRERGVVRHTDIRAPFELRSIPSPFLNGSMPQLIHSTVSYETARGCPFKCAYCSYNRGSYARMRFFPISRVKKEIDFILGQQPYRLNIVDDNFNINEIRAKELVTCIRDSLQETIVTLFLRADVWKISEKLVRLLMHKNIYCTIGVQSINPITLSSAKRVHNKINLEHNLNLLEKYGVNYILQFIIGLPGDRYSDIKNMIDWAFQYQPYDIHLQTLRINPQTAYEHESSQYGIVYRKTPPYTIYKTGTINRRDLIKAQKLASYFTSVYKRLSQRRKLIKLHQTTGIQVSRLLEMAIQKDANR